MLKNYLTIAFRKLIRHKLLSFINIFGLGVGIAACLLIVLYVQDEWSYDRFHTHSQDIYRIAWHTERPQTRTPHPMAQALLRDFTAVEAAVSLTPIWGPGLTRQSHSVRYGDKIFEEKQIIAVDTTFFQVFSFPMIYGNPETALQMPNGIVLTRETALKYFGDKNPVGKTLRLNDQIDFQVAGVLENIPSNAHFHFDFLLSYLILRRLESGDFFEWGDFGHYNYIRLKPGTDPHTIEEKIPDWSKKYIDWSQETFRVLKAGQIGFRLQPLTSIHLHSDLLWELEPNGNIVYIYVFLTAALFILIIACINFINLTTIRSLDYAKEVGMRKAVGASRTQLIGQFFGESFLYCLMSVGMAIGLLAFTLPLFNHLFDKELVIRYFENLYWLAGLASLVIVVGLLSGVYPAVFLSAFQPIQVLKGNVRTSAKGIFLRKGLVLLQFTICVALLIGTFVINHQLQFLQHKNLGFNKEQIMVVPLKGGKMQQAYQTLKSELLNSPGIATATAVSNAPGSRFNQHEVQWTLAEKSVLMAEVSVDKDFFRTMQIDLAAGRNFEQTHALDTTKHYFMLNETGARQFTWKSAVGESINFIDDNDTENGIVIGVVKDFHFQSLHQRITPMIFRIKPEQFNYLLVKIHPGQVTSSLHFVKNTWKAYDTSRLFEFSFLGNDTQALYQSEERVKSIFNIFSLLSAFIACLGLFGLATFTAQQRTKEIGIRKVLGASVSSITLLLSKDFLKLVVLSILIASPLAYYTMNQWLENFAYRIEMQWWMFVLAGVISLLIALFTISFQSIKAALANPVKSLRSE